MWTRRLRRAPLLLCLLALLGCDEGGALDELGGAEASEQALRPPKGTRYIVKAPTLQAAEPLDVHSLFEQNTPRWSRWVPEEGDPEASGCEARCGDDPICQVLCDDRLASVEERLPPGAELCNVCSRETGFRPVMNLRAEMLDDKTVRLYWDAFAGAERYTVVMQRWSDGGTTPDTEELWTDIKTPAFQISLSQDQRYGFVVLALNAEGELLQRSMVIFVDL